MLLHGISHVLIYWQQDLLVAPVELLLVVTTGKCRNQLWMNLKHDRRVYTFSPI